MASSPWLMETLINIHLLFLLVEPCWADGFVRLHSDSQGQSTDCQHVDTTYGANVDQCKTHTCLVGGNAFNYKVFGMECHVKKCIGGDLELTDRIGGSDVYALDGG